MNSPKPKRIVSKQRYRQYVAAKFILTGLAYLAAYIALFSVLGLIGVTIEVVLSGHSFYSGTTLLFMGVLLLAVAGSIFLGRKAGRHIKELDPVEPFSRRNIDRLAPAEALVRGSEAPQTPEEVLLRAATTTPETPQEQLLRATD